MKTVFKPLAELDFANLLNESFADTNTGTALINKYRQYLMNNSSSCQTVNAFLAEAKQCMYDGGIARLANEIANTVNENKVSWQLATACEAINSNRSSYNYLNRNAAATVEKLLEQNEENVVKYIKAGALKNVMFCESFRNIANSVYTDKQTVITEEYTAVKPVSYVEENEGIRYFEVLGNIFCVENNEIKESNASEVSGDFLTISRLLESNIANFDANTEKLTVDMGNATYEIYVNEDGCTKCTRTAKKKDKDVKNESITFSDEYALREHNRLVVGATAYSQRKNVEESLEAIARAFEHFENFVLLDNTQIVESKNDKFVVIENADHALAYLVRSNHNTGWKVNTTIVEALDFIKKNTNLNIAKDYKKNIDEQIAKTEEESAKQIQESIKRDEFAARRNKIEMLTEKYKDDPATLAVLSKIAESLNSAE